MSENKQNARQCFYQGQKVSPDNLNKLQNYSDQGQANLISALLGYGVVNGLEVSIVDGYILGISSGLAFNQEGTRLVLSSGQQFNISSHAPNLGEKSIKLGIVQDWIKNEPVLDSMGNTVYKKWLPTVEFIASETLALGVLELAEIKLSPVGIIEIKNTAISLITLPKQIQSTSAFTTKISEDGTSEAFINKKLFETVVRDLSYPIHSYYTQYTDNVGSFLTEEEPSQLFGGVWELQFNDKGVFFRTEGTNANESRSSGMQNDVIRNITGKVGESDGGTGFVNYSSGYNGCFNTSDKTDYFRPTSNYVTLYNRAKYITFNASSIVPTGSENRPINMLMRIWKKVA